MVRDSLCGKKVAFSIVRTSISIYSIQIGIQLRQHMLKALQPKFQQPIVMEPCGFNIFHGLLGCTSPT